mmetsp:Transcript_35791/g.83491  ORF Transcript_35791/g.83491 Transcript_35791/m.83491 type:complete len:305 (+) Transcript_35791:147-1061(+)
MRERMRKMLMHLVGPCPMELLACIAFTGPAHAGHMDQVDPVHVMRKLKSFLEVTTCAVNLATMAQVAVHCNLMKRQLACIISSREHVRGGPACGTGAGAFTTSLPWQDAWSFATLKKVATFLKMKAAPLLLGQRPALLGEVARLTIIWKWRLCAMRRPRRRCILHHVPDVTFRRCCIFRNMLDIDRKRHMVHHVLDNHCWLAGRGYWYRNVFLFGDCFVASLVYVTRRLANVLVHRPGVVDWHVLDVLNNLGLASSSVRIATVALMIWGPFSFPVIEPVVTIVAFRRVPASATGMVAAISLLLR